MTVCEKINTTHPGHARELGGMGRNLLDTTLEFTRMADNLSRKRGKLDARSGKLHHRLSGELATHYPVNSGRNRGVTRSHLISFFYPHNLYINNKPTPPPPPTHPRPQWGGQRKPSHRLCRPTRPLDRQQAQPRARPV